MPRKASAETQLRKEKRECKTLTAKYADVAQKAFLIRAAGSACANVCFNLSQREALPEHERETLIRAYKEWDEAVARVRNISAT